MGADGAATTTSTSITTTTSSATATLAGLAAGSAVWEASVVLVVLEEWEASAVSEALVVLEELAELEELVASVVRAESAGATGHRSGSTTRSTVAERLTEIEAQLTSSAA